MLTLKIHYYKFKQKKKEKRMDFFKRTGFFIIRFLNSITFFFAFVGHLSHSFKHIVTRHLSISWDNTLKILYYSGATLIIPLVSISALMAMLLAMNCYLIFNKFNLQERVFSILQTSLTQDILPLFVGLVLCIQASLGIINARIKITQFGRTPQEVILDYIFPIIVGTNITGLLFYIYLLIVTFFSLYFTFHTVLNITTQSYWLEMSPNITLIDFIYSLIKTLLYCSIVSLTAGYYYYRVATSHVPLRKAVSCILTRGSLWLTISSVYMKFINL